MIDDYTKKEIEKVSYELLKGSKSLGVFPTPVEQITQYSDFVVNNNIDLSKVQHTFIDQLKEKSKEYFTSGWEKVVGIFDRSEKIIYVDTSLNSNIGKKNFVQLHEVGHGALNWQSETMLCLDDKNTLSLDIEEQFEQEANYFASITLFQHDRFENEISKLKLGLGAVMSLRKQFGASVHATFRNYVLRSPNRCALLVLTPLKNAKGNGALCETRDLFYSQSFLDEIGELKLPDEFGFTWDFMRLYKFKKKYNEHGSINLVSVHGESVDCSYHYFYNSYNVFVFVFPKGEKNKASTKVVLRGAN